MRRRWESKGGRVSCIVDRDIFKVVFLMLIIAPVAIVMELMGKLPHE